MSQEAPRAGEQRCRSAQGDVATRNLRGLATDDDTAHARRRIVSHPNLVPGCTIGVRSTGGAYELLARPFSSAAVLKHAFGLEVTRAGVCQVWAKSYDRSGLVQGGEMSSTCGTFLSQVGAETTKC